MNNYKQYKAIFFDWDGTAVVTRTAPIDEVLPRILALLAKGIKLIVISGTTYERIVDGKIHEHVPLELRKNLYLGLGRGAFNYGYDEQGNLTVLHDEVPNIGDKLKIHELSFKIHQYLLEQYDYPTDIVFTRPNYCKIDLLVNLDRGGKLYLQDGELDMLNENLARHGYDAGVKGLITYAEELGRSMGLGSIQATTDAKFLEVGTSTKSNNVNWFMGNIIKKAGISVGECSFWGDEFTFLGPGVRGSDAFMLTDASKGGDFFDVSDSVVDLPASVKSLKGSVKTFIAFLDSQK